MTLEFQLPATQPAPPPETDRYLFFGLDEFPGLDDFDERDDPC